MKNLPIGIQSFEGLRNSQDDNIYVDKTEFVHALASRKGVYFLSRPRRFGKSLFISTLDAVFKGKKELFNGLWIENRWDWSKTYPVIRIDWTLISYSEPEVMKRSLQGYFQDIANNYGITLQKESPEDRFRELINSLQKTTKQQVVILIDEYDKPITDNLYEPHFKEIRRGVHDLYQVMKGADDDIRFIFITGVSKFSGLSVFSALNNPQDLSLNPKYATICGYTQAELEQYFAEYIDLAAANYDCSHERMIEAIAYWYNGYSWSNGQSKVYNPHSTMSFFSEGLLKEYWFKTASPLFLIDILEKRKRTAQILENMEVDSNVLEYGYNPETLEEIPLFFQTGYLTVKKMVTSLERGTKYTLDIPNYEVRQALMLRLLRVYGQYEENTISVLRDRFNNSILDCNEKAFETTLETIIAKAAPNQLKLTTEANYHALLLMWLNLTGFEVHSEVSNNYGRADAVWLHKGLTVIAELKYSTEAACETLLDEAMKQIHTREYYNQHLGKILLLGIAFSSKTDVIEIRCRMEVINR